jgi:hypothetical protein
MRLGAALTVGFLAALVIRSWRRERRRAATQNLMG